MDPITAVGAAKSAIELAKTVSDTMVAAQRYSGSSSLIDVSQAARVEPLLLVDADAMNLEYVSDVAQTLHSMFTGYYLQAVEMVSTIGSVRVADKLQPLNPDRKDYLTLESQNPDFRLSQESYKFKLPKSDDIKVSFSMEAHAAPGKVFTDKSKLDVALADNEKLKADLEEASKKTVSMSSAEFNKGLNEAAPLSVGKIFDVTLREGNQSATIKIAIRLIATSIPTAALANMLAMKNVMDNDMKERFHGWRAGRLRFWQDLVLCQDLVEKQRNTMIKDKSGVYGEVIARNNKNVVMGLLLQKPSVANASNLVIVTSDTMELVSSRMYGGMAMKKVRDAIFESTNLMIMAVIDKGFERVTFYHRGIDLPSEMSIRDIKTSNKGGGSEVTDILKAFIAGKAP